MSQPDFEGAKQYALARLANELPTTTVYHSLFHTQDDVVPAAKQFADIEGIKGNDLLCLMTAAYFHDLGHIQQAKDHEDISAAIAREVLPRFSYSPSQVSLITQLIMETKLPQSPPTLLAQIIVDADMNSLGRDDFLATSLKLKAELEASGVSFTKLEWLTRQHNFLQQHRFFTRAARQLRDEGKQRNLKLLERLIAEEQAANDV